MRKWKHVTYAHGSKDIGTRNVPEDLRAIEDMMKRGTTGLDVVTALAKHGFNDVAESVLMMLKGKVTGDYLHTSALFDSRFQCEERCQRCQRLRGTGHWLPSRRRALGTVEEHSPGHQS